MLLRFSLICTAHVLAAFSYDDAMTDRTCGVIMVAISLHVAVPRSLNTPTRVTVLA